MSPEFALSRVEAVGDDRLEVEGTWSGVRGVRFVRPALVVHDGSEARDRTLLATLDHKPWPAEEGALWTAAFPWEGDPPDVARLQLAVAPSIVVALGPEDAQEAVAERDVAARAPSRPPASSRSDADRLADAREERDEARARAVELTAERDRLAAALESARREVAARPARDAVRAELRQRDEALAARDAAQAERDAVAAERDQAVRERDALRQELREREQAAAGAAQRRERALAERDDARREGESAIDRVRREGERAVADAIAQRDAARAELHAVEEQAAERERRRAQTRIDEVQQQLAVAEDERDRALSEPAGVAAPVPVQRVPREHEAESTRADWAARIAAILALLVLLVLFITFINALG